MKKALIQDHFIQNGGAEKCVRSFLNIWNDFEIYGLTDFLSNKDREEILKGKHVNTSFIQNLPNAKKWFRHYLPFYPIAIEQFDLTEYDLIISSSYSVAKGVLTNHNQIHISYMYSPMRYAWDLYHQYLRESGLNKGFKGKFAKGLLHYLRNWDVSTANRPDHYIAISNYIADRIKKVYNKEAEVVYPPVDTSSFNISKNREEYYFTSSRMVPYKRIDLIVEAFSHMPDKKLIVCGDGPEFNKIKNKAKKNIELLGYVKKEKLIQLKQKAKAFIFAAEEDFGIAPLEAQACGIPVIAFGKGGALETIIGKSCESKNNLSKGDTGVFFLKQNIKNIIDSVNFFEKNQDVFNDPNIIRANALRFDKEVFESSFKTKVENIIQRHNL